MMLDFIAHSGTRVISGGQTGVDIAALRAAMCLGYRTGGYAPRGFKTLAGKKPQLGRFFKLVESQGGYAFRTWKNVEVSDATLIIAADIESPGTKTTIDACATQDVPYKVIKLEPDSGALKFKVPQLEAKPVIEWLLKQASRGYQESGMFTLNVAGNSSSTAPGIFPPTYLFMLQILAIMNHEGTRAIGGPQSALGHPLLAKLATADVARGLEDSYEYYLDLDPKRSTLLIDSVTA